jgi:signal transduction histidine kinase/Tfp pilus assembly protein PilF
MKNQKQSLFFCYFHQMNPNIHDSHPVRLKPTFIQGLLFFVITFCFAFAESSENNMTSRFNKLPENKAKVDTILHYLSEVQDSASIHLYYKEALTLASNLNYIEGIIRAHDKLGVIKRNLSNYTEALAYHKKALELAENISNIKLKVQVLNNIGVVYRRLDDDKQALNYHMKALKMAEEINDPKNICISVNSIGNIYLTQNQPKSALNFFRRALPLEQKRGNLWGVSINLHNIGAVYESLQQLDSALFYYKKSLNYDYQINQKPGIAICYNAIGNIYLKKREYNTAEDYFKRALQIHIQTGDKIYISVSYNNIANTFLSKKDYNPSLEFYQKGLDIALSIGSKSQAQEAYKGLSESYEGLKRFDKSLECYKKSAQYADSVTNENNIRHITQIQAEYDYDKQHQQITILKKEKETSKLFILMLSILMIAVVVISLFYYRNFIQKRKIIGQELDLKEQKIIQLEKEKQLLATQSVLQGEEAERIRLARDLHDGLGGLLSGIKLTLSNMKGNVVLSAESVSLYHKALEMLDTSIRELRRVAHNMMPEALVKFGLKDALFDFCNTLRNERIKINFQYFGEDKRLDSKIEIGIYRIAQELINNAFKYSQASELLVQLIQEHNRIHLTVQDNGKGFDTSILSSSIGSGIANIRSRVESLKGRFDLHSEISKGTEASVEFHW